MGSKKNLNHQYVIIKNICINKEQHFNNRHQVLIKKEKDQENNLDQNIQQVMKIRKWRGSSIKLKKKNMRILMKDMNLKYIHINHQNMRSNKNLKDKVLSIHPVDKKSREKNLRNISTLSIRHQLRLSHLGSGRRK